MRSIPKISRAWLVVLIFAIVGIGGMVCAIANIYAKDAHWLAIGFLFYGIGGITYLALSIGAFKNRAWVGSFANPNAPRWAYLIMIAGGMGVILGSVIVELSYFGIL